jgi:hypothetical protein
VGGRQTSADEMRDEEGNLARKKGGKSNKLKIIESETKGVRLLNIKMA